MMHPITAIALLVALGGCAVNPSDIGRAPHLSPVGTGLLHQRVPMITQHQPVKVAAGGGSLWHEDGAGLFRDPRASNIGDVITVKIKIKDRATLDNSSNRSRDTSKALGANFGFEFVSKFLKGKGEGKASTDFSGKSSASGKGAISRSESIDLLVAAVVTEVLPNGNLVISGRQEVRVNFELRELGVAGIVRPRDIAEDNSISYDKVAEARISYGGRGRITEVQQPPLAHQVLDILTPF